MKKKFLVAFLLILVCFPSKNLPFTSLEAKLSQKVYAVISTNYEAGMFSNFLTVLGFLEYYEKGLYTGVKVNFENRGLYYEHALGSNWWEYYFEPIALGDHNSLIKKYISG
jgi:hypothetical protein